MNTHSKNFMRVLDVQDKQIVVQTPSGKTVVARYEDSDGIYFFNHQLEKEYAVQYPKICDTIKIWRNQGWREAHVLQREGSEILVNYYMKNGSCFYNVIDLTKKAHGPNYYGSDRGYYPISVKTLRKNKIWNL